MGLYKKYSETPQDLSRSIQVIGAGYSRTGTVSFSLALERLLNGPVCHSGATTLLREEAWIKKWISLLKGGSNMDKDHTKETLKDLLAGYVAVTDNPAIMFTGELASTFPNAKVICTTRDPDTWWRSMEGVAKQGNSWWLNIVFSIIPTLRYYCQYRDLRLIRHQKTHNVTKPSKDLLAAHTEYVKRVVPADRLYFFNVKDGWEPLCKILDCPVPDEPFPHANEGTKVQNAFKRLINKAIVRWVQMFAVSGTMIAIGLYGWKRYA